MNRRCRSGGMNQGFKAWFLAMLICTPVTAQAEVYKWIDAEGNVHYGDEPPSESIPEFRVKPPPVVTDDRIFSDTPTGEQRRDGQRRLPDSFEADRRDRWQAAGERKQRAARQEKNCNTARARLRSAREASLIFDYDQQGNRIFYDQARREKYLRRLRKDVSQWCDSR